MKAQWQVNQARDAVRLFLFYKDRSNTINDPVNPNSDNDWDKATNQRVKIIRLKQLSHNTEKTYLYWLRAFRRFSKGLSPYDLQNVNIKKYLTYLAVERHISSSTQNLAFNALLFFYRYILDRAIGDIGDVVRAPRRSRLPVVLTRSEMELLFNQLSGTSGLMAKLIYGGGLRLTP